MTTDDDQPADGYADGTYGQSGVPASSDLAEDKHVEFSRQQLTVIGLAREAEAHGITGHDVQRATGWGDSPKSRAMSNLLADGKLVRLAEVRDRGHVHVLPHWVQDRPIKPYNAISEKHYQRGLADGRADNAWIKVLVADLDAHLAHEDEPVEVRTTAGGWRDVIDYIPEEYR
jgi:hypothetical protein